MSDFIIIFSPTRNQNITRILRHRISQGRTFFRKLQIRCKNGLFGPIFHQFQSKIAAYHPLWMSFGISVSHIRICEIDPKKSPKMAKTTRNFSKSNQTLSPVLMKMSVK
jgi:hypothetical protein